MLRMLDYKIVAKTNQKINSMKLIVYVCIFFLAMLLLAGEIIPKSA